MKKLISLALLSVVTTAQADWSVDTAASNINFLSTKKEHIVEVHQFDRFSASIADSGMAELSIDLASVNTMIPIRNERMQEFLFETAQFSAATFKAKVDTKMLAELTAGQTVVQTLKGDFSLHGIVKPLSVQVNVTALADNKVLVQSIKPVLINSKHYDLQAGVDKLKSLAKLPSIGYTVPVTFSLIFTAK